MGQQGSRRKTLIWVVLGSLITGAALSSLDGRQGWLQGWLAYALVLAAGAGSIFWVATSLKVGRAQRQLALMAFASRLGVGLGLMALLPVFGYQDNPASSAGYLFKDAFVRDGQAWTLASSGEALGEAFSGKFSGDQYGGMLALSAAIYRYLSPDTHRPILVLVLTATAAAWGVLFTWRAVKAWTGSLEGGDLIPNIAAWIMAFYPESVFLGSSHMREPFVISSVAILFYGITQARRKSWNWLGWFGLGFGVLLVLQSPVALAAAATATGLWLMEPGRRLSWAQLVLLVGILLVAYFGVVSVWANLPSLETAAPVKIFFTWIQHNFGFQAYVMERSSGMLQNLLRSVGEQWRLPLILVYGAAQPVLPATIVDPAAFIWRAINITRAAGWYLLAPFLLYGFAVTFHPTAGHRRLQRAWLNLVVLGWILIAAANAGGDQWDNPRYRTVMLTWQAMLAAWAWWWAVNRRDAWLKRLLVVEGLFVILFLQWYLSRYYPQLIHLNIRTMIALTLAAAGLIMGGGWIWDRMRKHKDR